MENVNTAAKIHQQQQQQQQQQQTQLQHLQLQQHHQEQQQQHEHQQQFCLRWHNHQTSLLSTLPILLDQSHLTDVTISAEGRTLRAHRVVLSACSTFFLELFRTLDATNHPVIIIPGASFATIVALLTFMYSGEVNVYEEQIPMLLNLAETLGIKGLADVQNNLQKSTKRQATDYPNVAAAKDEPEVPSPTTSIPTPPTPSTPPLVAPIATAALHAAALPASMQLPSVLHAPLSPTSLTHPLVSPLLATGGSGKLPTALESLFLKSLQFYPNLLPQPLNFSQTALNKTNELLAKYQQQCSSFYQGAGATAGLGINAARELLPQLNNKDEYVERAVEEGLSGSKRLCLGEKNLLTAAQQPLLQQQQQQQKDIKRIDRIVENLRCGGKTPTSLDNNTTTTPAQLQTPQLPATLYGKAASNNTCGNFALKNTLTPTHLSTVKPSTLYATATQQQQQPQQQQQSPFVAEQYVATCSRDAVASGNSRATPEMGCLGLKNEFMVEKKMPTPPPASPQGKPTSNSKLYATCFICHKQLSNQYNLRVHLETHQNVRYACNVCSHVSRSKDALRKHVSYRHPGAPSPCESEARRKRSCKGLTNTSPPATGTALGLAAVTASANSPAVSISTSPCLSSSFPTTALTSGALGAGRTSEVDAEAHISAAHLNSAYMFLPNQFQFAAVAAAAAQQQQQQHHLQNLSNASGSAITNFTDNISSSTATSGQSNVTVATSVVTATTNAESTNCGVAAMLLNSLNIKTEPGVFANSSNSATGDNIALPQGAPAVGAAVSSAQCSPSEEA